MSNIHLSIYPETVNDVLMGVLDYIRANGYPELHHQYFDTDDRKCEALVSSYRPNEIDRAMEELGFDTFTLIDGHNDVKVDSFGMYRFDNGKYYIITF